MILTVNVEDFHTGNRDMHIKLWALGFTLISLLFCDASLATSHNWQMCSTIIESQRDRSTLETLFRFAQIAERPKHSDNEYMQACSGSNSNSVPLPNNLVSLNLSQDAIEEIDNQLQERQHLEEFKRARFDVADNNIPSITCMSKNGSNKLPIAFQIRVYFDLVTQFLNINISTGISTIDESDGVTRVRAGAYLHLKQNQDQDQDQDQLVFVAPGTEITDVRQILSNYIGDECAFPAIHLVTDYVCKFFSHDVSHNSEDNSPNYFTGDEMKRIRQNESYSIALTGHSLGGQAVQYIAEQGFNICKRNGNGQCPKFEAYAFASTRNCSSTNTVKGLTSYRIEGDKILSILNPECNNQLDYDIRYQPKFRLWSSYLFGALHSIDNIQKSICDCLQGSGMISSSFVE